MKKLSKHIKTAQLINVEKSPFSESQLRGILENVDNSVQNNSSKFNWKIKMSAIGITIIGLIIGALTMNPTIKQNNSQVLKIEPIQISKGQELPTTKSSLIAKSAIVNKTALEKIEPEKNEVSTNAIDTNTLTIYVLDKEELKNINIFQNDCSVYFYDEDTYPPYSFIQKIQSEEMKNLGYPTKGILKKLTSVYEEELDPVIIPHDLAKLQPKVLDIPAKVYARIKSLKSNNPLNQAWWINTGSDDSTFNHSLLDKKTYDIINKIMDNKISLNGYQPVNIYIEKSNFKNIDSYCFILSSTIQDSLRKLTLFIYPKTERLLRLLPARLGLYQDKYSLLSSNSDNDQRKQKKIYSDALSRLLPKCTYDSNKIIKYHVDAPNIPEKISAVNKLVLTNDELSKLGIFLNNGILEYSFEDKINTKTYYKNLLNNYFNNYAYNRNDEYILVKGTRKISICQADKDIVTIKKYTGWDINSFSKIAPVSCWENRFVYNIINIPQPFDPLKPSEIAPIKKEAALISFSKAYYWYHSPILMSLFGDENSESNQYVTIDPNQVIQSRSSRLVPISIKYDCSEGNNLDSSEFAFFYYVNREFIELLPERYKVPLSRELDVLEQIESGDLPAEDACKAIKGQESYMGVCSITASNIVSANVYPNPVSQAPFTADVIVRKEATISVDLYNSTGDLVKRLLADVPLKGGKNSVKFENTLSGIAPGMYILSFVQDNGERVTRNIIIK